MQFSHNVYYVKSSPKLCNPIPARLSGHLSTDFQARRQLIPHVSPGTVGFFSSWVNMPQQQHANPLEFAHWARGIPPEYLARHLRCTPATARAWQSGKRPAPWWAVHVLRLDKFERDEMARQMGYAHLLPRLGIVRGQVIEMRRPVAAIVPRTHTSHPAADADAGQMQA